MKKLLSMVLLLSPVMSFTACGKSLRGDDSAEMIDIIYDNMYYDVALLFDWGDVAQTLYNMVKNNNTNLATEYARIENQIASEIEKTMEVFTAE